MGTAIAAYAGPGTVALSGNILTYTARVGGTAMTNLAISLPTADDSLVKDQNFTSQSPRGLDTGASILVRNKQRGHHDRG